MKPPVRIVREFNEEFGKWVFYPMFKDRVLYMYYGEPIYSWRKAEAWFDDIDSALYYLEEFSKHKDGEVVYEG